MRIMTATTWNENEKAVIQAEAEASKSGEVRPRGTKEHSQKAAQQVAMAQTKKKPHGDSPMERNKATATLPGTEQKRQNQPQENRPNK